MKPIDPTRILVWCLFGLGVSFIVLMCVFVLPQQLYPPLNGSELEGVREAKDRLALQDARAKLQNDARTTLLQATGATFFVVTAYLGWQQLQNSRHQLRLSQDEANEQREEQHKNFLLIERGQITERFTRSVEQLGSTNSDVRVGGLYGLARIASDSPANEDKEAVEQVIAAFIRGRSPWPPRLGGQYVATAPIEKVPTLRIRAVDVQVALTILVKPGRDSSSSSVVASRKQLSRTDLRKANLWGAALRGYWLECCNLSAAGLRGADLRDVNLEESILVEANLHGADLRGANLRGARLQGADLSVAKLGSPSRGALSLDRNVNSAYWQESGESTNLTGAVFDKDTKWPEGFDPAGAGCCEIADDAGE